MLGYLFLPHLFPAVPPSYDSVNMALRDRHHPFGMSVKHSDKKSEDSDDLKWAKLHENRVCGCVWGCEGVCVCVLSLQIHM